MHMLKRIGMVVASGALVAGSLFTVPVEAAEPSSFKVTLTSVPGHYLYNWTGEVLPGATGNSRQGTSHPCLKDERIGEDIVDLELVLQHSRVYKEVNIVFIFSINYEPFGWNDVDLDIYGPSGSSIGDSTTFQPHEEFRTSNLDAGKYNVIACPGSANETPQEYNGSLEVVVTERSTRSKTTTTVAPAAESEEPPASGSTAAPTSAPPAPRPTSGRPAVGAGRTTGNTLAGPIEAALPANEIGAAPSAFISGAPPSGGTAAVTPPPVDLEPRKTTATMPFWTAIVASFLGLLGGVIALLIRRRQGLDAAPGTAVVPVN